MKTNCKDWITDLGVLNSKRAWAWRWAKNLFALSVGLAAVFVMWRATEKLFHTLNEHNDARISFEGTYYSDYVRYDAVVGPKGAPNVRVRSVKKVDGKTLYDVAYSTDEFGRRNTYPSPPEPKQEFLVFFGCSFTFGEGLSDEETLPWHMAELAPAYRVYNYGCSGYGPQQMLAEIESGEIMREIPEKSGVIVYVFIPHHVRRAIGSMRVASKWGRAFPNYVFDAQGDLVRQGDFTTGRPELARVYNALAGIDILRFFGVDFPPMITARHLDLAASIIQRAQQLAKSAFPKLRFCVLLYPDCPHCEMSGSAIAPYLQKKGVECLDFTGLLDMRQEGLMIEGDEHPSDEANKRVAEELATRLTQNRSVR